MATSAGSVTFFLPATSLIAARKHADHPAANSCSGLMPAPGPPSGESLTSSRPSSLWKAPPSRPPVVCAFAVYRSFSRIMIAPCQTVHCFRLQELQQIGVDLVLAGTAQAVRSARVDSQARAGRELDRGVGRSGNRHDVVVVAMDDQRGHVQLLEVVGLIRFRERLDPVEDALEAGLHALEPERIWQPL